MKNNYPQGVKESPETDISKQIKIISHFCTGADWIDYLLEKWYLISNKADWSLVIAIMDTDLGSDFAQDSWTFVFYPWKNTVIETYYKWWSEPVTSIKSINNTHIDLLDTISSYCDIKLSEILDNTSKSVSGTLAA